MRGYLFLTVLIIGAIQTPDVDGAPMGSDTAAFFESSSSSRYQRGALQRILIDAIFNVTDNFYAIKDAFQPQPGIHKICIPVTYNITCANQSEDQECVLNCTTGYNIIMLITWTEFDSTDTAGNILFYFASNGFSVFGFDWSSACDIYESRTILELTLPSLPCNDTKSDVLLNYTDQTELQLALQYVTTLVSKTMSLSWCMKRLKINGDSFILCKINGGGLYTMIRIHNIL